MQNKIQTRYFCQRMAFRLSTLLSTLVCLVLMGVASQLSAQVTSYPAVWSFGTTAGTKTLNISLPSSTLGSISVVTQGTANLDFTSAGGSCSSGSTGTCTVQVRFSPTANGMRYGAAVLTDRSGNVLLAVPLSGVGTGPSAAFVPGTISTFAGVQYSTATTSGQESGDGGPATQAYFWGPNSFALDGTGNIYIADWQNYVVRKVDAKTGVITLVAGIPGISTGVIGVNVCSAASDAYGDGCPAGQATLYYPEAVLVDGSGNLFITDSGDNLVRMVAPTANGITSNGIISLVAGAVVTTPTACQTSPASTYGGDGPTALGVALCYTNALTLDASGNLYISDYFNNEIHMVAPGSNGVTGGGAITTVAGGGTTATLAACTTDPIYGNGCLATGAILRQPQDLAVDASGNLYIADNLDNMVREVTAAATGTGIITALAGPGYGYGGDGSAAIAAKINGPFGLKLDGAGNIYFTEYGNNTVRQIATNGIISTVAGNFAAGAGYSGDGGPATSAQLNTPTRIWSDGAGNLLIADYGNNVVRRVDVSDGPTVPAFASTSVGQASTAQNVTMLNNGTSSLKVSKVAVAADFNLNGSGNTCSSSGFTLTAGTPTAAAQTCVFGIEFEPTVGNGISGSVALTDNSITGTTQTIGLSGTGVLDSQTITFPDPVTQAYGVPLTLVATASSGLPVSFSVTTGASIATLNADVLTFSGVGSVTVLASQGGNDSYAAAPSVSQTFTVAAESQKITFANPGNQTYGEAPITLSASASSGLSVTFKVTSGPATVSGSTLTLTGPGSVTFQAAQAGDTDYAAATSVSQTFSVAATPTYTLSVNSAGVSIAVGGSGTATFTVTSNNYAGTVSFATSVTTTNGNAADVTASATPVALTSGGTTTSTLTITTTSGAANRAPAVPWKSSGVVMLCAVLLGAPFSFRRNRAIAVLLTIVAISLAAFLMACGEGSSSSKPAPPQQAARTYTVTVTPAGSGLVTNATAATVTVTVQ